MVGVLGTFHTGKSFLLNQMMGRMGGFETGPTVRPTTEGLWVWGMPLSAGAGMNVLLLDTEGLAAPGNTPDYDAKIFAVATLLSTHIIYNSVKIVDKQSLDYLQVLARRAQLFALKSLLVNGQDDIESMIRFPPLTWVVEDFFQDMINGETPTQWLHRLMEEQGSADATKANFTPGLSSIFPEAYCHTVFLPASGKDALKRLDLLSPSELSPEYRADIDSLVAHVVTSLRKQRAGHHHCLPGTDGSAADEGTCAAAVRAPHSGPALAAMVKLLVKASNQGTLSKMPDVWELFMKDQAEDAKASALTVFSKTVAALATGGVPITKEEYEQQLEVAKRRADSVFQQALFGLQHKYLASKQADLDAAVKTASINAHNQHREVIRTYINRAVETDLANFDASLEQMGLPMTSATIKTSLESLREHAFTDTFAMLERYHDKEESKRVGELIKAKCEKQTAANLASQVQLYETAHEEAKKVYKAQLDRFVVPGSPLETATLETMHETAHKDAMSTWDTRTQQLSGESILPRYEGSLQKELSQLHERYVALNGEHVASMCGGIVQRLDETMKKRIANVELPTLLSTLQTTGANLKTETLKDYEEAMRKFSQTPACARCLKELQEAIASHIHDLTEANTRETRKKVKGPLEAASELVAAQSDLYYRVSSWRKMAQAIAEKKIGDNISHELRSMVIEQWLTGKGPHDVGQYAPHGWITFLLSLFFFW